MRTTMMKRAAAVALAALATACAGPATQYYSLADAAPLQRAKPAATASLAIELAAIAMPERLARPQMVLRKKGTTAGQGGPEVDILEQHRWSSSFEDELRDALSSGIAARLGAIDATRTGTPRGQQTLRIGVQLRRFDAMQDGNVDAGLSWTLRKTDDSAAASCDLSLTEPAGSGVEAVAAAAQRLTTRLSDAIAKSAAALQAGQPAPCAG